MFSSTWSRIALSYALLVLITAGVLAFLLGEEFQRREEESLRARLADQARAVAFTAAPLLAAEAGIAETNALAHKLAAILGTRVTLVRLNGTVAGDSQEDPSGMENHAGRPEVAQVLTGAAPLGSSVRYSTTVGRRLLYVAAPAYDPADPSRMVGVARVAYPMTSVEQAHGALWWNLALAVLLVTLPAALLGALLARSIAGPLSTLRQAASRFGSGDLRVRSSIAVTGEIGELSREFNLMAERLSGTIAQLTAERNRIAAIFEHMHEGILLTDPQGRVEAINPAAARVLGTTADRAIGQSLIRLTHSHRLHQALQAALDQRANPDRPGQPGEAQTLEVEMDGRTLTAVVTPVPSSAGGDTNGLVVLHDVTELRRLERARRDFVANISHELRTPLASIKLLVETLNTAIHEDPQAAQDFLRRIDIELDGLTQLVRELLELSRIESGHVRLERRLVPAGELVHEAAGRLRAQAERAGLVLGVQAPGPGEPPLLVYADAERIEQVLVNLLHNAIKFTPPGGQIVLRAEAGPDAGEVVFSVADTGIGIPPEDLPRIFERFYKVDKARTGTRDRDGGTGLGLSIARHIVQAHGGRIWAESTPGIGSTFYFTLPTPTSSSISTASQEKR
jgi:two-component system phosphate regulon sensor histidine kinase PhoR